VKCVSVCGKMRIGVRKSAYQCADFSLVEVSAPITPYTPKGYGVVAHAPLGGGQPGNQVQIGRSGGQRELLTVSSREEVEETDDGLRIMPSGGWGAGYRDSR